MATKKMNKLKLTRFDDIKYKLNDPCQKYEDKNTFVELAIENAMIYFKGSNLAELKNSLNKNDIKSINRVLIKIEKKLCKIKEEKEKRKRSEIMSRVNGVKRS